MSGFLRQSTASQSRSIGPFISDSDFKTPQTGLTIANTDIKLVVNGGASANKNSGGGTHRVNGVYGVTFDATDTATVGEMEVNVLVSGALIVFDKFTIVEEAVYDAQYAASAPGYVVDQPVNVTKFGGTTVTARDIGASVLLSSGTGTGQIKIASGYVAPDWGDVANKTTTNALTGTTISTSQVVASVTGAVGSVTGAVGSVTGNVGGNVTGSVGSVVGLTASNLDTTVSSRLAPTVAARTLDVSATGEAGIDWANIGSPTTTNNLSGTTVKAVTDAVSANTTQLAGQTVTAAAGVTFPTSVASPTNITAGTITTVTNLTNAPTSGDLTATMKASVTTAATAATPALSAAGVDAIWDEAVDGSVTARQSLRLANSANGGKLSGAATTAVSVRDLADTKDRISATTSLTGNRTAVTLDLT